MYGRGMPAAVESLSAETADALTDKGVALNKDIEPVGSFMFRAVERPSLPSLSTLALVASPPLLSWLRPSSTSTRGFSRDDAELAECDAVL